VSLDGSLFHPCTIDVEYKKHVKTGEKAMRAISATDLARNTREILDQVAAQGETVVIERNHTIVAQIVPAQRTMTAAQALAGLGPLMLTPKQAVDWIRDSRGDIDNTVRDPWV
jgi:antitoxin (DNA-binding transcriptional repressor) of toxin-antitoxin stability system